MLKALPAVAVAFSASAAAFGQAGEPTAALTLWYEQPASRWVDALPVGNGRLGAMVFGGVDNARIQLNEDTIWAGPPVSENPEGMAADLAEARRLFFAGKPAEGQQLVQDRMMAPRISPRSYQTLGDLTLNMIYEGRTRP